MGGKVYADPVSYVGADGRQQIAIASGHAIFAFGIGGAPVN